MASKYEGMGCGISNRYSPPRGVRGSLFALITAKSSVGVLTVAS